MDNLQKFVGRYSTYLEEIRKRIFSLTKIFVVVFLVGFFTTSPVLRFLISHLNLSDVKIVTTSPFQLIDLSMSIGFFFACVVTVPFFIYYFYSFLKSGLLKKERKIFILSLPVSLLLFFVGFSYGVGILYYAIRFVAEINVGLGVENYWDISLFLSQIVTTSSLLGVLFIFPLILTFLIRSNILNVQFFRSKRRHVIVAIFILVSLLPPTDGLSLILMAVPLMLIFELTIFFNREKGRNLIE